MIFFTTKEIKVTIGKQVKNGQTFQICKETITKEIAPDVTACAIWLNNRLPDKWKRNRDKVLEIDDEDSNLQVTIVRGPKEDEQDDSVNQAVTIGTKSAEDKKVSSKDPSIKRGQDDPDYWPDDWEEEE